MEASLTFQDASRDVATGSNPFVVQALLYPLEHLPLLCKGSGWLSSPTRGKHQEEQVPVHLFHNYAPGLPVMVLQIDSQQSWKEKELYFKPAPTIHGFVTLVPTVRASHC